MRGAGETPLFKTPKRRSGTSNRMLVITILTVLLPPLGLVCLWRGARCPMRGKILLSALGVASMTLIFTIILSGQVQVGDDLPISYQYAQTTAAPTAAPAPDGVVDAPGSADGGVDTGEAGATGDELGDGVVPANPAG